MQFSNTTSKDGLIQRCELYTGIGDAGISGNATMLAQFTSLINSAYEKVVSMILESMDEWDWDDVNFSTTYPIATQSMVANQRDYAFPTSTLKIKRVDLSFGG